MYMHVKCRKIGMATYMRSKIHSMFSPPTSKKLSTPLHPIDCCGLTSLSFDSSVVVSVMILVSNAESAVEWLSSGLSSIVFLTSDIEGKKSCVNPAGTFSAEHVRIVQCHNVSFDNLKLQ